MSIRDMLPFRRPREDKVTVRRGPDRNLSAMPDEFDDLCGRFLPEWFGGASSMDQLLGLHEGLSPGVDVRETDRDVRVVTEMPGVEEKDLSVTLTNHVLAIRGERRIDGDDPRAEGGRRYERMVTLDADIDPERVSAAYRNGVLTVVLPKLENAASRGRRIPVKAS